MEHSIHFNVIGTKWTGEHQSLVLTSNSQWMQPDETKFQSKEYSYNFLWEEVNGYKEKNFIADLI